MKLPHNHTHAIHIPPQCRLFVSTVKALSSLTIYLFRKIPISLPQKPNEKYIANIKKRECHPHQVRVKVAYCGICGTDIHEYLGGPIFAPKPQQTHPYTGAFLPIVMGHEMSGTITELGENVKGLSIGQKVAVNPSLGDSQYGTDPCVSCLTGRSNTCSQATFYGLSAPGGGFANEITVHQANIVPVPENVPLRLAALAEPLAVAWHMVRISGFVEGQNVLILGAGPIGLALLMILKAKGAGKVIVSEVSALRMQYAQQLGADKVVNPIDASGGTADPVIEVVRELTGEGVDISYEASGLQATLDTAIAAVMPGGVIFNVAVHEKRLQVNINDLVLTEKKMTGGISYTSEDFQGVMELLASQVIPAEKMISSVVPLANIIEGGFHELINNKTKHVKILIQANGDLED